MSCERLLRTKTKIEKEILKLKKKIQKIDIDFIERKINDKIEKVHDIELKIKVYKGVKNFIEHLNLGKKIEELKEKRNKIEEKLTSTKKTKKK